MRLEVVVVELVGLRDEGKTPLESGKEDLLLGVLVVALVGLALRWRRPARVPEARLDVESRPA